MIRFAVPNDTDSLVTLAGAINLFGPEELEEVSGMLTSYFEAGAAGDENPFWVVDDDHGPVGLAYCEPERMTNGTWNLQLIAVHPDRQGQGRGTALLRWVEERLTERDARLLLVETSGTDGFKLTREFYPKCGYEEEARIRDFYEAGDDKIVFRKLLSDAGTSS